METKTCYKCKQTKTICDFNKNKSKKSGFSDECKECLKEYRKTHYQINKDKIKKIGKTYYENNKVNINKRNKEYANRNKWLIAKHKQKWKTGNKEKINSYNKTRRIFDANFKLISNLRTNIWFVLKRKNYPKNTKTADILGCTLEEFKKHLESQFEPWMNWDNYGNPKDGILKPNKSWDIDHIIPTSLAKTEEDVIRLNHYSNLRPLCSYINRVVKR